MVKDKYWRKEKKECPVCKKMVCAGNMSTHQKSKKCKAHNDKTDAAGRTIPATSPGVDVPLVASVSQSKILTEINLKGEFEKMTEILNPKRKNSKEKKYQCSECGATFDNLQDGKCPDCGVQLQ